MKKSILFLVVIFTSIIGLFAQNQRLTVSEAGTMMNEAILTSQNDNQIIIRFNLNELELVEVETGYGMAFIATSNKAPWMLQEGAPELFYLTSTFIIPDRGDSELEISYGEFTDFENIEIAPSKGNLTRNIDPKTIPFVKGDVYQENEFYPGTLASLRDPFIMRDVRGQSVDIYPVQYNPVTKILRAYSEITVTINNTRKVGVNEFTNQKRHNTIDPAFNQMYSNFFLNYSSRYPMGEEGELLIICHPPFMADMKPYIDWKRTIGRKTTIVSTTTTGTTASEIKDYISRYYDSSDNNLAYVLLVGDEPEISTCDVFSNLYETSFESDVFYGQLVGSDPYLEVLIGRMSAENIAHVQTQVQRTIWYERDISTTDTWLNTAVGLAANFGSGFGHDGGENDYIHMNNIRDRLLSYGYNTVHQEYSNNCPGVPNTSNVQISQRFNAGAGMANYCNHGDDSGWLLEGGPYYGTPDVGQLQNAGMLPYIFSAACMNGRFMFVYPCFAEAWMRATQNNQPTGAVATFMATIVLHWAPPMTAQDEFVNICLDIPSPYPGQQPGTKKTFAGATLNATQKMLMVHDIFSEGALDDYNSWVVFGDPTLMIRTKTPQEMVISHSPSFFFGMNSFTVSCDTEGALATISYIDDNGDVIILGTAIVAGGIAEIVFNEHEPIITSTDLTLAITGFNKVTYIGTVTTYGIIINNNTTWNSNINIYEDIVITNNSTLTINNCTISLCDNVNIFVYPGSKLIINGSTLTNGCNNAMWQGITVLGNPAQPLLTQRYQGYIELKNGGRIENAICGITVTGGGIVEATDAHFINNTVGVKFESLALGQMGISGKFTQANFVLNNSGSIADFEAHLKMESSGSVSVIGCNFSSTAPQNSNIHNKNYAITASNTSLTVKEYCPSNAPITIDGSCPANMMTRSVFTGFTRAISTSNSGVSPNVKVRYSTFNNNLRGVSIDGVNSHELIRNYFYLPQSNSYGAYISNATGYKIEENRFENTAPTTNTRTVGLRISNSGGAENEVYKNYYFDLYVAQQFISKNSSQVDTIPPGGGGDTIIHRAPLKQITGLQTLCNTFTGSQYRDILIGNLPNQTTTLLDLSIRRDQGSVQKSAGNLFYGSPILNIENDQSQHLINYYCPIRSSGGSPNPEFPSNRTNVYTYSASSNPCPSRVGIVGGEGGDIGGALSQYDEWNDEYEYWLAQFLAFESDDEEEYHTLLDMISYYSALKDNHFNSIIIAINDEMESSMGYEVSNDDEMIRELDDKTMENISHSSSFTSVERRGTLNLRYLLLYRGNYTDYLSVVETYLKENNYKEAMATLAKMYDRFEITEEQTLELQDLEAYIYWLLQLEETENSIYTLSANEIEYLINYVETHIGRGKTFAKIILCELYDICIEDEEEVSGKEYAVSGGEEEATIESVINNTLQVDDKALLDKITIIPNPTAGELTITNCELRVDKIEILDMVGRMVSSHHLLLPSSHQKIDISHLNSGIYFVKITTNAGEVVKKVVKQ